MSFDRSQCQRSGRRLVPENTGTKQVHYLATFRLVFFASDSSSLSSRAKDIERYANAVEQSRWDQFVRIFEALESGTYRVPARDIARKLIEANTD